MLFQIILVIAAILLGGGSGYALRKIQSKKSADQSENRAEKILAEAKAKQQEILQETKPNKMSKVDAEIFKINSED